jgi:hypothetical protein
MLFQAFVAVGTPKRPFEVADVFRQFGDDYRAQYPLSSEQRQALRDILNCRTAALGGHVDACPECGGIRISYNPCNNRHCPQCGAFEKAQWLENRKAETLPITYFHVIFTTDHAINDLARVNKRAIYELLFRAATATLKAYGQQYLGGEIGITAVLHILRQAQDRLWGEDLSEHIHLHCIVTGGALVQAEDGDKWQAAAAGFLFPIVALSADYRDRLCDGLVRLYRRGKLQLVGVCADLDVAALVETMRAKAWEVFVRPAFEGVEGVYDYLGRYVNRIAISNYRILDIRDGQVSFTYHDNKDKAEDGRGKEKVLRLPGVEFIRRFLLHVLPPRFVRIRYYGLHHSGARRKLLRCRVLLGLSGDMPIPPQLHLVNWLLSILEADPRRCPFCGRAVMARRAEFGPLPAWWLWLLSLLGLATRGRVAA